MFRLLVVAMLLALGACGTDKGDGGEGLAAVRPSRVTAAELRAEVSDPQVRRFYEGRDWAPAWTEDNAKILVDAIGGAPRHALRADDFLAKVRRSEAPAAREAALTLAALDYAGALARGRIDPRELGRVYTLGRPDPDLAFGLHRALEHGDVGAWLAALAPQDEEYRRLSEAFLAAMRAARDRRFTQVPSGPELRPGRPDRRLPAIAEALRAGGYWEPPPPPEGARPAAPARYTPELVAAVRRLQEDWGLEPNGVIGPDTLYALNTGPLDRARTLAVGLERRRWLRRDPAQIRVDVNIAGASLSYWRDGHLADRRAVVVGQPDWPTPELLSPIFRLVANPTWTVPRSIEEEEIAPKGEAYLARNNMVRRDGMIVQLPGPDNALGLVKFDLENDHAIYLHDTPAKPLFERDRRYLSHGCVRVHDALGFAQRIAADEGVTDRWLRALATGDETFVELPREIPVRLLYHTAFLDGGRIRFREDAYGWDNEVAEALGFGTRQRRDPAPHVSDLGP